MKEKFKKILAIGLCLLITLSISSLAFAEETTTKATTGTEVPPPLPDGEKPQDRMPKEMQEREQIGKGKGMMGRNEFSDVSEDAWYSEYVNFVSMRGIMKGKNGTFRPTETITRAEYILALYNAAGAPEVTNTCSFSDVAEDSEFANAIAWAEANGIATGMENGAFMPDSSLTREMAMTFLYRAFSALNLTADIPTDSIISEFSDNTFVSDWAKDAMNTLVNMGIISGTDKGKLNPQGSLINAEVATMIFRMFDGNKNHGGMPDNIGQERQHGNKGKMPEMTEEEKTAMIEKMKADLDAKLEAGEITQEEYDEMAGRIENGDFMFGGRGNRDKTPPVMPDKNVEVTE